MKIGVLDTGVKRWASAISVDTLTVTGNTTLGDANADMLSIKCGNLVFDNGATSPTLNSAAADKVSVAAIDDAVDDRRLHIQAQLGSPISIGNNTIDFQASTGYISIAGTNIAAITANGIQVPLLGVGTAPTPSQLVRVIGFTTGATTQFGSLFQANVDSGCTVAARGGYGEVKTAAGSYNTTTISSWWAQRPTIGSGATATNVVGFDCDIQTGGSSLNASFRGINAAASNTYNLYMSGTAMNYLAGNLGVGTSPSSAIILNVVAKATGGTTCRGQYFSPTFQSDVTTAGFGIQIATKTQAATFTMSQLASLRIEDCVDGAGSTITLQDGVNVQALAAGTTNNRAFVGNVASTAAGPWNCYMVGTAPNYFNGAVQSGHTGTALAKIEGRATSGAQVAGSYDGSNYWTATTGNTGITVLNAVGSAGQFSVAIGGTNALAITGSAITITNGVDVATGTSTGSIVARTASQKLAFWGATPTTQYSTTGTSLGFVSGSGFAVQDDSTFTGNVGSTAYRVSDIVRCLKICGIMAS